MLSNKPTAAGKLYIQLKKCDYDHTFTYTIQMVRGYKGSRLVKRFPKGTKLPAKYKDLPMVFEQEVIIYPEFENEDV